MSEQYDFSGYATKNDLKCTDGRTIRKDAFKHSDGTKVPLVWQHNHNEPSNVLGHAVLENREDGVYAYCKLNSSPAGMNAKLLVEHGDINALSIYANGLKEKASNVIHGVIREVSLVLSGANPGALIDNLAISHSDGSSTELDDEAIIYTGLSISGPEDEEEEVVEHADGEETVEEIFSSLNEKQRNVVYAMLSAAFDEEDEEEADTEEVTHSDEEGVNFMKKNVFDQQDESAQKTLTHADFQTIVADARKSGSFRDAFLAHAGTYGIDNIDYLFPDAKNIRNTPDFLKREDNWVGNVMSGTHHSPFSRIKTMYADITADEARAKGYVTGAEKTDEVFGLLKRVTTPQTIYKKQKLDRDDIIDITDLDVVAWLKMEMRMMLDEEVARAVLVGDGRSAESDDKIVATNIRPIYTDDLVYSHKVEIASDDDVSDIIDSVVEAREYYKGSGSPTLYTTTSILTSMLLLKDTTGRRIYPTIAELKSALRVSNIVEVPVMDSLSRVDGDDTLDLVAILVNLSDYTIGADQGGAVSMFDDFDIDYNQYKYLIETRISGALTRPKAALVFEQVRAAG